MTYEEWYDTYKPRPCNTDNDMWETDDPRMETMLEEHVWTLVEAEGLRYICAGFHHVNRLAYFVTNEPWTDASLEILDTDIDEPHNRLIDLTEQFEQPTGEGWAVFNLPDNPRDTIPADFLTVGIERFDEEEVFASDEEALDWVTEQDTEQHRIALDIHAEADLVRAILWGPDCRDRRTPPE